MNIVRSISTANIITNEIAHDTYLSILFGCSYIRCSINIDIGNFHIAHVNTRYKATALADFNSSDVYIFDEYLDDDAAKSHATWLAYALIYGEI